MENALSVQSVGNIYPKISPKETAFNNQVFKTCKKNILPTELRDGDAYLYAAQGCLARAFVTAPPDQAKLIALKMSFLQSLINNNIEQDQSVYSREMADKSSLIMAKANAKAKTMPLTTDLVRTSTHAAVDVANSSAQLIKQIKTPSLNLVQ